MNESEQFLIKFTKVTLLLGVLIFIVISIRFFLLLKKGAYRKDSKRDKFRAKFETKTYIPAEIIGGTALVFIIPYISRSFDLIDFRSGLTTLICFVIFYMMTFVLPEQLVILYCKFRFKSFDFDKRGYLEEED